MTTKANAKPTMGFSFTDENVEKAFKFKPDPDKFQGLCKGVLESVEIIMDENPVIKEDGKKSDYEYAGLTTPRLRLTFVQVPTDIDPVRREYTHDFKVVTSRKNDGTMMELSTIESLYKGLHFPLRHIVNAYKTVPGYCSDATKTPSVDHRSPAPERVEQFKKYFEFMKAALHDKDGVPLFAGREMWLKLVADYATKKFHAFPGFVEQGFIEPVVANRVPAICIGPRDTLELVKGSTKGGMEQKTSGTDTASGKEVLNDEVADLLKKYQ